MEDQQPRLELTGSRLFNAWLASAKASLAFTTYQAGKLFLIGLKPDGRLSVFERTFSRSMGLGTGPEGTLWMSWPKRSSGVETDITEDTIREVALPRGLVDSKVCAIDETWSGLRLTRRRG